MSKKPNDQPKPKRKPHRRREFVVQKVLRAALAELRARGVAAFRVERVAKAADVNKTTIYRRWPTKEALVKAALAQEQAAGVPAKPLRPAKGRESPRDAFVRLSEEYLAWTGSEVGLGIARIEREGATGSLKKLVTEWQRARREPLASFARRQGFTGGVRGEVFVHAWAGALLAYPAEKGPPRAAIEALGELLVGS